MFIPKVWMDQIYKDYYVCIWAYMTPLYVLEATTIISKAIINKEKWFKIYLNFEENWCNMFKLSMGPIPAGLYISVLLWPLFS